MQLLEARYTRDDTRGVPIGEGAIDGIAAKESPTPFHLHFHSSLPPRGDCNCARNPIRRVISFEDHSRVPRESLARSMHLEIDATLPLPPFLNTRGSLPYLRWQSRNEITMGTSLFAYADAKYPRGETRRGEWDISLSLN